MMTKYNFQIADAIVTQRLHILTNQIYKLLPNREEGNDWKKPLSTIIQQLVGMGQLLSSQEEFFPLICKLEGLKTLTEKEDFPLYRRIIFQCLGLMGRLVINEQS